MEMPRPHGRAVLGPHEAEVNLVPPPASTTTSDLALQGQPGRTERTREGGVVRYDVGSRTEGYAWNPVNIWRHTTEEIVATSPVRLFPPGTRGGDGGGGLTGNGASSEKRGLVAGIGADGMVITQSGIPKRQNTATITDDKLEAISDSVCHSLYARSRTGPQIFGG